MLQNVILPVLKLYFSHASVTAQKGPSAGRKTENLTTGKRAAIRLCNRSHSHIFYISTDILDAEAMLELVFQMLASCAFHIDYVNLVGLKENVTTRLRSFPFSACVAD